MATNQPIRIGAGFFICALALNAPATYAEQCKNMGKLTYLGNLDNGSRSIWLSKNLVNSGQNFELQSASGNPFFSDNFDIRASGLHMSASTNVSNGNGGTHKLFDASGDDLCLMDTQNQKGGIEIPSFPPLGGGGGDGSNGGSGGGTGGGSNGGSGGGTGGGSNGGSGGGTGGGSNGGSGGGAGGGSNGGSGGGTGGGSNGGSGGGTGGGSNGGTGGGTGGGSNGGSGGGTGGGSNGGSGGGTGGGSNGGTGGGTGGGSNGGSGGGTGGGSNGGSGGGTGGGNNGGTGEVIPDGNRPSGKDIVNGIIAATTQGGSGALLMRDYTISNRVVNGLFARQKITTAGRFGDERQSLPGANAPQRIATSGQKSDGSPQWDAWADARFYDIKDRRYQLDTDGNMQQAYVGVDSLVTSNLVLGLAGAYEGSD